LMVFVNDHIEPVGKCALLEVDLHLFRS
jgi:hypothetical protein